MTILENGIMLNDENKSSRKWPFYFWNSKTKDPKSAKVVNALDLFRYATWFDTVLMLFGIIGGLGHGTLFPSMLVVFGNIIDAFSDRTSNLCNLNLTSLAMDHCPTGYQLTASNYFVSLYICRFNISDHATFNFQDDITKRIYYVIGIGFASVLLGYMQVTLWSVAAERQTRAIRETLFRSILEKDIAYFDKNKAGVLITRLTDDINKIHDGIGDKIGSTAKFVSTFIIGLVLGFINGWKLTLVILSVSPLLFIVVYLHSQLVANFTVTQLKAYDRAGGIAEEVFSAIRTVVSYNGQEKEQHRYEKYLDIAKHYGIRKGAVIGITMGFVWFIIYNTYALGYWYGAKLIQEEKYRIGDVVIVFFCVLCAVHDLGQVGPHWQSFNQARVAAYNVWQVIDTRSKMNQKLDNGLKLNNLDGDICFSNVDFSYPSRPDVPILNGVSFDVKQGERVAIVGPSGSGKSTCIQLLQKFYELHAGTILIGSRNIDEYNLRWLRENMSVVSQEPILFQTTIRDNILLGTKIATEAEIHAAATMANAHDFIMSLPDKYDTLVGERGVTLSGGQKQRIAIARALIRNPKILLLDEATSALDTQNEELVQEALLRASRGRTTLIIAHRLPTIRHVNRIIVLDKGQVVEEGDHDSLIHAKGIYHDIFEQQNLHISTENGRQDPSSAIINVNQVAGSEHRADELPENPETVKKNDEKSEQHKSTFRIQLKLLTMNKPEWLLIIIGCCASLANGGIYPAFGIILSKIMTVFQECDEDVRRHRIVVYVLVFIGLAAIMLITMFLQSFLFAWSGEALTKRLRAKTFQTLLHKEISFFDHPENNSGALCHCLASDVSSIQGATGVRIGSLLQNMASLGVGIIISFIFSWALTLLILIFVPFIVIGGFLQKFLVTGFTTKDNQALEKTSKIAMESIQNIRTVVQLTKEEHFYQEYCKYLRIPHRSSIQRAHLVGLFFALTQSVTYFSIASVFRLGAHLVSDNKISLEDLLLCLFCIAFAAQSIGLTALMSPDHSKAVAAGEKIIELLRIQSPVTDESLGIIAKPPDFIGHIEFNSIDFVYPTRPQAVVLKNFQLTIQRGQHIALVGSSGCGKSTVIQLLERFYEASSGTLLFDSKDIRTLNLNWYRSQIGIVPQEPSLFDMTIRENIAYGDHSRENIPLEEIIEVAKLTNIHDFISHLPDGYETNCGAKGTQLSGGQKQRIGQIEDDKQIFHVDLVTSDLFPLYLAIARALIRNPKILIFDEATSALDSENERYIQEAIDRIKQNRTSITIAHRLSTIQNADMIYVLDHGTIVESGTHQQLMDLRGHYSQLVLNH